MSAKSGSPITVERTFRNGLRPTKIGVPPPKFTFTIKTSHTIAKMDWNSLKDQVSNISLYDVKASVRKVQNGAPSHSPVPLTAISKRANSDPSQPS